MYAVSLLFMLDFFLEWLILKVDSFATYRLMTSVAQTLPIVWPRKTIVFLSFPFLNLTQRVALLVIGTRC